MSAPAYAASPSEATTAAQSPANFQAVLCLLRKHHRTKTMTKLSRFELSKQYAQELKAKATPAEREMCRLLDSRKISYVFQSNICDPKTGTVYIADFRIRRMRPVKPKGMPKRTWLREWWQPTHKLFVEIDGSSHERKASYDAKRTRWIESHRGAIVLRFSNADVFERPDKVLTTIEAYSPAHRERKESRLQRKRRQLISGAEAVPAPRQHVRPCSDCPFARTALPGWLGGDERLATADEWLRMVHGETRIECHTTGNQQCAGAAVYRANVCKVPRDPAQLRLPADKGRVFASPVEFKRHHEGDGR